MSTPVDDSGGLPVLREVEDTPIPVHARVVQVAVDEEGGALPSRLHQRGEVVGRGSHLLHVRFEEDQDTVAVRPDLVRVLHTGGA
jgi:hypothetical protein